MLFLAKLVSKQPSDMSNESWQSLTADQVRTVKQQLQEGKIVAIYREVGEGVIAVYNVSSAEEMDRILSMLPMSRFFAKVEVRPIWDMRDMILGTP
jgi:muconolactone delta-isomerase